MELQVAEALTPAHVAHLACELDFSERWALAVIAEHALADGCCRASIAEIADHAALARLIKP